MSRRTLIGHWRSILVAAQLVCPVISLGESVKTAPVPLTLDRCQERVVSGNLALQAARQRLAAAEQRVRQARAVPNPRLAAEAENFGGSDAHGA